jgi:hypothetical protein
VTKRASPILENRSRQRLRAGHTRRRARAERSGRRLAWTLSIAAHVMVFAALFWPRPANPPAPTEPIQVSLVQLPQPEAPPGPPDPAGPPTPIQIKAAAPQIAPRPARHPAVHAVVPTRLAQSARELAQDEDTTSAPDNSDLLSASDLAGAASAGEGGGGGGGCDIARAVQQALRRDPLVHSAVAGADRLGKSVMLWNGDWVRSGGQEGRGLSAVREAITWEVAFAPEACRNARLHGLVLLSLADGTTRFAVGAGDWRWSDLLGVR